MNNTITIISMPPITTTGNVTVDVSMALIGIILGAIIIVVNLKLNSPLLWWDSAICFVGVYFEPRLADTFYRVGAGIVIIVCVIAGTFSYRNRTSGRGAG